MEMDSFFREHVCDSNLLEFPCPCRICKEMINYRYFELVRFRFCTCDRQKNIDDGKCSFIIHKSCTETTPRQIQHHPFHPQHDLSLSFSSSSEEEEDQDMICNACGDDLKTGFVYKCSSTPHCSFALHVKCAFLSLANISNQGGDLQLPLHPHPLISCNRGKVRKLSSNFGKLEKNFEYSCTCCKLPLHETTLLVCLECKALLHKSCAEIPWNIEKHPFHPSHPLVLLPRVPYPSSCFKCNLCRQKKQGGFAYHCPECGFFLDVHCASLKPKRNDGGDDDFQQLSHFHPLIVCTDEEYNFPLARDWREAEYSCGACGDPLNDGDKIYFCRECECLLDQSCADHSGQDIKHVLHPEHELTFWYRPLLDGHRKCRACLSSIGDSGYQCFKCEFYLDIKCARSDYTVLTSPLHRMPLVFHGVADRKQRCNVCNKRCNTSFYCSLARDFAVHVHCMEAFPPEIQSVLHPHPLTLLDLNQSLGFFASMRQQIKVGLSRTSFICQVCRREEKEGPRYRCKKCDYQAHPHCVFSEKMTFQEFKMSFTTAETKEEDSVLQVAKQDKSNWLYYSHTATTDIEMPSQKLRFPPWENWDAESKVIEIQTGIWILEEFAPLLNALFRDYGNFCSNSNLSPYPKMLFVTMVCEVLHNMSITNVTNVTKNLLLTWFQGFALGKHAGLDMTFAFDRLFRVATAQFGLHVGLFIDPNFARVGDDEEPEECPIKVGDSIISLGKFKLCDEIKELEKEREELEEKPKEKRSVYEWKKEWLTDTLELMGEKAFVVDF